MLLFEKPLFRKRDRETKRDAYGHGWKDERVEQSKSLSILVVRGKRIALVFLGCLNLLAHIVLDNWNELGKWFPTTRCSNSIRFYSEWKGSSDGRWEVARGSRWWLAGCGCKERDSLCGSCCQKSHPVVHPKHTDLTICALCSLVMSSPLPSCHPKRSGIGAVLSDD